MEKLHKLEDYNNKASASSGVQRAKPVSSATYEDNDWINEAWVLDLVVSLLDCWCLVLFLLFTYMIYLFDYTS